MTDREKVFDFMNEAQVLFLATTDGDQPKCRPLGFRMLVDDQIYFLTGTFKNVYKQLEANPKVEFVGRVNGDFLRYTGKVAFDDDKTLYDKAFETMPMLEKIYNDKTGYVPQIFHLENAVAEFRTMENTTKEKIEF